MAKSKRTVIRSQKTYRPEPAVEVHVLAPAYYVCLSCMHVQHAHLTYACLKPTKDSLPIWNLKIKSCMIGWAQKKTSQGPSTLVPGVRARLLFPLHAWKNSWDANYEPCSNLKHLHFLKVFPPDCKACMQNGGLSMFISMCGTHYILPSLQLSMYMVHSLGTTFWARAAVHAWSIAWHECMQICNFARTWLKNQTVAAQISWWGTRSSEAPSPAWTDVKMYLLLKMCRWTHAWRKIPKSCMRDLSKWMHACQHGWSFCWP